MREFQNSPYLKNKILEISRKPLLHPLGFFEIQEFTMPEMYHKTRFFTD